MIISEFNRTLNSSSRYACPHSQSWLWFREGDQPFAASNIQSFVWLLEMLAQDISLLGNDIR
jgi:hypothetical protein